MTSETSETLSVRQRRRRYDPAFKRSIVEHTLAPGASVARIAREHDVNADQLSKWRRQFLLEESAASRLRAPTPSKCSLLRITHASFPRHCTPEYSFPVQTVFGRPLSIRQHTRLCGGVSPVPSAVKSRAAGNRACSAARLLAPPRIPGTATCHAGAIARPPARWRRTAARPGLCRDSGN